MAKKRKASKPVGRTKEQKREDDLRIVVVLPQGRRTDLVALRRRNGGGYHSKRGYVRTTRGNRRHTTEDE